MSENTSSNNSPVGEPEVFYVTHRNHLHDFELRQEADEAASALGGRTYAGSELIFALEECDRLRALALSVTDVLMAHEAAAENAGQDHCDCDVCQALRDPVKALAVGVVEAFKAGRLNSSYSPERLEALGKQVDLLDVIESLQQHIGCTVQVVASNPEEGQKGITPLIGRTFEVDAINPVTNQVQVIVPEFGGLVTLGPDEYIFVEASSAPAED